MLRINVIRRNPAIFDAIFNSMFNPVFNVIFKIKTLFFMIAFVGIVGLMGCSDKGGMFNHTNDYKNCQERPPLCLPKGMHTQAFSDQYAIPDLEGRKQPVVAVSKIAPVAPSTPEGSTQQAHTQQVHNEHQERRGERHKDQKLEPARPSSALHAASPALESEMPLQPHPGSSPAGLQPATDKTLAMPTAQEDGKNKGIASASASESATVSSSGSAMEQTKQDVKNLQLQQSNELLFNPEKSAQMGVEKSVGIQKAFNPESTLNAIKTIEAETALEKAKKVEKQAK